MTAAYTSNVTTQSIGTGGKGDRSSRQGRNPAGASPAVPVTRFRHLAMPLP